MSREHCPQQNEQCPYFNEQGSCYSDTHHRWWPRPDYTSALERTFRQLPENQIQTCRDEHDAIHEGPAPLKPSIEVMHHAVEQAQSLGYVSLSENRKRKIGL